MPQFWLKVLPHLKQVKPGEKDHGCEFNRSQVIGPKLIGVISGQEKEWSPGFWTWEWADTELTRPSRGRHIPGGWPGLREGGPLGLRMEKTNEQC